MRACARRDEAIQIGDKNPAHLNQPGLLRREGAARNDEI
jgi:hypothetical protein